MIIYISRMAYEITHNEYKEWLRRLTFHVGNDEDLAARILAIAVMDFEGRNNCSFATFVYLVAKNEMINDWRKKAVRPKFIHQEPSLSFEDNVFSYVDMNSLKEFKKEEIKKEDDRVQLIREALEYLRKKNKNQLKYDLFFARYFLNMTIQEVSDVWGICYSHAKTSINRAKFEVKMYIYKKKNPPAR